MFIHTQQWDFLNSIYFCFVTLSTIGFGDFVPKNKNNQDIGLTEDQTELVSVTVMCQHNLGEFRWTLQLLPFTWFLVSPCSSWFAPWCRYDMGNHYTDIHYLSNIGQEEVKNKVKNIAIQLGIVKTEDDDYLDWFWIFEMNIFTSLWLIFRMQLWSVPRGVNQSTHKYFILTIQNAYFYSRLSVHHRKSLGSSKSHSDKLVLFGHWWTVNLFRDNAEFSHECQHSCVRVRCLRILDGGIK